MFTLKFELLFACGCKCYEQESVISKTSHFSLWVCSVVSLLYKSDVTSTQVCVFKCMHLFNFINCHKPAYAGILFIGFYKWSVQLLCVSIW